MTQVHYYQASGKLKTQLIESRDTAEKVRNKMFKFAKKHGATSIALFGVPMRPHFGLIFGKPEKVKEPSLWKPMPRHTAYKPVRSKKVGQQLDREMDEICKEYPSGSDVAKLIDMQVFKGAAWRTPGMRIIKSKTGRTWAILTVPEDYVVPERLQKTLKRISDLQYEKLVQEHDRHGEGITLVD